MGGSSALQDLDSRVRVRARWVKMAMLAGALYCFTFLMILLDHIITATSFRGILPTIGGAFVFGSFLQLGVLPLYLLGCLLCRLKWKGRCRWILPLVPIVCLGLLFPVAAGADRIDPSRILARMSGVSVPEEARVVRYENRSSWLESHILIEFHASPATLESWIRAMGFVSTKKTTTEKLGHLACPGDCAEISVDWAGSRLIFMFVDV